MKKIFCPLVVALTLTALTGCGLKGPLYFPPKDDNSASAGKNTGSAAGVESGPVRNDRGTGDRPTQTTY